MKEKNAIHSVEVFLRKLKKDDVFWHITSLRDKPYAVEGPCEIRKIGGFINPMVQYARPWVDASDCIVEDSILDLTNSHHGVFLNHADALVEFDRRCREEAERDGYIHA